MLRNTLFRAQAGAALLAGLITGGCARNPTLKPAVPSGQLVNGKGVMAERSGVRMVVWPNTWSGDPENLEDAMTPLEVSIENQSARPLAVRYRNFTLAASTGFSAQAIPPFKMEGAVLASGYATVTPEFAYGGFFVAPYYSRLYGPAIGVWGRPFAFDAGYYTAYNTWQVSLPTADMLRKAIPEGVLDADRGRIRGFLYFNRVQDQIPRVTFEAELVNADTGQRFGLISVPFVVS